MATMSDAISVSSVPSNEEMTQHGINFDWKNLDDAAIDELIASLADLEVDADGRDHQVRIRAE